MRQIPRKLWNDYIKKLERIDKTAAAKVKAYLIKNGIPETFEASQALINYSAGLVTKYGEASASLACEMYDAISLAEGAALPAAVPAAVPDMEMISKAINGTVKYANIELISGSVERLVKMPSADTMLQNAIRDKAEYAWIPSGDTCMFCLTLASNGWQRASRTVLDGGHAEHIHAHCDCTFAIRHNTNTDVAGYKPEKYREMYDNADTSSYGWGSSNNDRDGDNKHWQNMSTARINGMRREAYAENKEKINAQKRSAYEKRKELNSSRAEELDVN